MDLCVTGNELACADQRFWGTILVLLLFVVAVASIVWAHWSAFRERKNLRMATPVAMRSVPLRGLRAGEDYRTDKVRQFHPQASRVKVIKSRFPLRGLDKIIAFFLQGGAIEGF